MRTSFLAGLLLAGASLTALAAEAASDTAPAPQSSVGLPPVASFFRHADVGQVELSPSGQWLAFTTASPSGRVVLAVVDTAGKTQPTLAANYVDADVRSFYWVNDDRLVYNLIDLAEGGGNQGFGPGLDSSRRDGSETRQLIDRQRRGPGNPSLPSNYGLLRTLGGEGNDVIVGRYQFDSLDELMSVSPGRLDVTTGRVLNLAAGAPDHAVHWWFDAAGEPRLAGTLYKGQYEYWWHGAGDSAWRSLGRFPSHERRFTPVFVGAGDTLFVTESSTARHESVLSRFDFKTMKPESEPIVSTPGFDISPRLVLDSARTVAYGVRLETDAASTIWFEPAMKAVQKRVDAYLPGKVNIIDCHRCAEPDVVLVKSYSDQDPGSYWIYRPATDKWQPIGQVRKDIDPKLSAQVDFQRIKARDGEDLPVWVTARPLVKGRTALRPAVVLVHGGPWLRGTHWGWNAEAQFLASRGYVVIEPEFRGSTGFGGVHFRRGWKEWGGKMQDDVADATRWAIAQGLIDGRRVCIAGASYGGYSALMGLVRDPDLYRCGVAWVGVTDPRSLFKSTWASDSSAELRDYSLPELLGDPEKDAAALARAAPVERAAEIRAPLLLAYGAQDRRVPISQGRALRSALQAAGHDPEWIVYGDEGHGWLKVSNQIDFWQRVERFLDTYLK